MCGQPSHARTVPLQGASHWSIPCVLNPAVSLTKGPGSASVLQLFFFSSPACQKGAEPSKFLGFTSWVEILPLHDSIPHKDNHKPTSPGTLDPEPAQPAPHIPTAQHCSEPSLTLQSFTEEPQCLLQAGKQTWTPRAGPGTPSHCLGHQHALLQPADHSVGSKERFQTPFLLRSRMVLLFLLPKSSQQHLHSSARPSHQEIFQRAPGDRVLALQRC